MERRHYLEVAEDHLSPITSITRIIVEEQVTGYQVTGYNINGNVYDISVGEEYNLLVTLPVDEPYKGLIGYTDVTETWTKDGLYMHISSEVAVLGNKKVYIKDFLELIPDSYQAKMIDDLSTNPSLLNDMATYLVNNTVFPKEFSIIYINDNQWGVQDQVVAYVNGIYYINSMNDYVPYQNLNNTHNSAWAIPDTVYDPVAKASGLISNGIRQDLVLKSNKLIYLIRYEGMTLADTTQYVGGSSLVYLKNLEIEGIAYQVYLNPKFLYSSTGFMTNPLIQSIWQTVIVEDAFIHLDLKGKILKV